MSNSYFEIAKSWFSPTPSPGYEFQNELEVSELPGINKKYTDDKTLLYRATTVDDVKKLLDNGINPNIVMRWASRNGNIEVVKFLVRQPGVDPGSQDNYAIKKASYYGDLEVVKFLVKQPGVDPSAQNNYAIKKASSGGHLEVVKILVKQPGVNPGFCNDAIRIASLYGNLKVVKFLESVGYIE